MTDQSSRRTTMVDTQVRPSDVTKFPIIEALLAVRKETYVPAAFQDAAYAETAVSLGDNRSILEPRAFAKLLDAVNVQPDELVLDIGAGLGYSSAVLGQLAQTVCAVEVDEAMAQEAETNLAQEGVVNVFVSQGDLSEGAKQHAPYDVIIIEGGVDNLPVALTEQLAEGGRIAGIFSEAGVGRVKVGTKIDDHVTWRNAFEAEAPILPGFETVDTFTF